MILIDFLKKILVLPSEPLFLMCLFCTPFFNDLVLVLGFSVSSLFLFIFLIRLFVFISDEIN